MVSGLLSFPWCLVPLCLLFPPLHRQFEPGFGHDPLVFRVFVCRLVAHAFLAFTGEREFLTLLRVWVDAEPHIQVDPGASSSTVPDLEVVDALVTSERALWPLAAEEASLGFALSAAIFLDLVDAIFAAQISSA